MVVMAELIIADEDPREIPDFKGTPQRLIGSIGFDSCIDKVCCLFIEQLCVNSSNRKRDQKLDSVKERHWRRVNATPPTPIEHEILLGEIGENVLFCC